MNYGSNGTNNSTSNSVNNVAKVNGSDTDVNRGSTVADASFNFISSLVGAGVIGFGGAIATSGGLASLLSILFFAVMSKLALDMVVNLAATTEGAGGSYEDLGFVAMGKFGKQSIMISKGLFAFGCLVALVRITKDNLAPASYHMIFGDKEDDDILSSTPQLASLLQKENLTTMIACTAVMLPLSFLRNVTPLAKLSGLKVITFTFIVFITVYLQVKSFKIEDYDWESFKFHWLTLRSGFIENLGAFVFAFVAQHTVHLVFLSLKPNLRNVGSWKAVSCISMTSATLIMIFMGFAVYMTFWEDATSSMFELYEPSFMVDLARVLLSFSSLLTYPMCLISTREMIILSLPQQRQRDETGEHQILIHHHQKTEKITLPTWLIPGFDTQLVTPYHEILTIFLFMLSSYLALAAESLNDVLNLVGCATGTVIAFILPSLFWFKLRGFAAFPLFLLIVGGATGTIGTIAVLKTIIKGHGGF